MTRGRSFLFWRRVAAAAQAAVALGLPFVTVGGESALRLDVPAGRLHAFGASYAIDEAFVVLAATLLVSFAFLLVTLVFGRVWCGWACPQTVLADITSARSRPLRLALVAIVSAVVAADLLWWFVSPYEFYRRLAAGTLGPVLGWSWLVLFAILFADLALLRARFCATACPYAKLQGVLFDRSTLVVAYDARRATDCVDCGACVRVCPTGIDIREGLQVECIACAACIDACTPIMAKLRRAPDLVGYFHGEPGGKARPLRPGVLALGAGTVATAALLAAVVAGRALLDVSAIPDAGFLPRAGADGSAVNAYSVGIENHGREPVTVSLGLAAPGGDVTIRPDRIDLASGERRQVRLVATARGFPPGRVQASLSAEARAGEAIVDRRTERIPIVVPEGASP